jgi:hypothetical protein
MDLLHPLVLLAIAVSLAALLSPLIGYFVGKRRGGAIFVVRERPNLFVFYGVLGLLALGGILLDLFPLGPMIIRMAGGPFIVLWAVMGVWFTMLVWGTLLCRNRSAVCNARPGRSALK